MRLSYYLSKVSQLRGQSPNHYTYFLFKQKTWAWSDTSVDGTERGADPHNHHTKLINAQASCPPTSCTLSYPSAPEIEPGQHTVSPQSSLPAVPALPCPAHLKTRVLLSWRPREPTPSSKATLGLQTHTGYIRNSMKLNSSPQPEKMSLFKNSLNSFKHPTQSKNKEMSRSRGPSARPAALTAWASGSQHLLNQVKDLPNQVKQPEPRSHPQTDVQKLLSGLHNCWLDLSS